MLASQNHWLELPDASVCSTGRYWIGNESVFSARLPDENVGAVRVQEIQFQEINQKGLAKRLAKPLIILARLERFELPTAWFVGATIYFNFI